MKYLLFDRRYPLMKSAFQICVLLLFSLAAVSATGEQSAAPKIVKAPVKVSAAKPVTVTKNGFSFAIGPEPVWVVPFVPNSPNTSSATTPPATTPSTALPIASLPHLAFPGAVAAPTDVSAMHYRQIDEQLRLEGKSVAAYRHTVRVVDTAAGLPIASQIEAEFDPSYQTLTMHSLELVRGTMRINKLDAKKVQLLQRERQLEQRMYDGRVTMSVVLDDVRVGDEIHYAYTVTGLNPVFEGKFVEIIWMMAQRGAVENYQVRLLAPNERKIFHKIGVSDVKISSTDAATKGWRETLFTRQNVPQLRPEPGSPASTYVPDMLQLSEYADWAEVAAWGARLFEKNTQVAHSPRVEQKFAEIRAALPNRNDQIQEALRFVQQDVRYFGTEIGTSTHQPAAPDKVMEQRFGDFKDKVALLGALFAQLGVPARPTLVSLRSRATVAHMLPSPLAFDHVIARAELDGQTLWLDGTRAHQSGPLQKRQSIGLGFGLELHNDTRTLSALPSPFEVERMRVDDLIRVTQFADDPILESVITYRGDLAEIFRDVVATQGLATIAPSLAQPYVKAYPKLRSLAPVQMENATDDDAVKFIQRFAIPEFWRFPDQRVLVADIVHWGPVDWVLPPKSESRRTALAFAFPGWFRHSVRVEFSEDVYGKPSSTRSDEGDAHVSLRTRIEGEPRVVDFLAEAHINAETVEPGKWTSYSAALNKALPKLGLTLSAPSLPPARFESFAPELIALEAKLRSGKISNVTANQTNAHRQILVLTAQLDAGRLPPPLRAQTLVARGIKYDHVGRLSDARADFDAALALVPDSITALNAAAENALSTNELPRARTFSSRVLELHPSDPEALDIRARVQYFAGDMAAATADRKLMLDDRAAMRRGFPLIWLWLSTKQSGQDAGRLVDNYPRETWPTEWPRQLMDAVIGAQSDDLALDAAKKSKTPLESLCEAHFYLGEKYFAEGDMNKAREHWRKALNQGVTEYIEHAAASLRLNAK